MSKRYRILLLLPLLFSCSRGHDQAAQPAGQAAAVTGLRVESAAVTQLPETLEVVGTVKARTSAVVSPRIPGTVTSLRVREGDRVRKGQLLLTLESPENQAGAAAAGAGLEEALRSLEEARARQRLADSTYERYSRLLAEQAISRQEFDVKQTEREVAVQGVARAEARVQQARQSSRGAGALADYGRIAAPISGVVSVRQASLGATVFPGQPLMTIDDDHSFQLELAIPESLAAKVRPGTPVQVTLEALGSSFAARVAETVPAADPQNRSFTAKVDLTQKGLASGMFGRGTITLGQATVAGLLLPRQAIREQGALTSVWVVDKDRRARMRLVKVGRTIGERVEILAGLATGEQVVVTGTEKVSEGARVQ